MGSLGMRLCVCGFKVFCLLCVYTKPMYILLNTTKFSKLNTHVHTCNIIYSYVCA